MAYLIWTLPCAIYTVKNVGSKPVENATEKTVRRNGSKSYTDNKLSVVATDYRWS